MWLHPAPFDIHEGDDVYVWLRSDRNTGRAKVLSGPIAPDPAALAAAQPLKTDGTPERPRGDVATRYLVRYAHDGSTCSVNEARIHRVYPRNEQPTVIVTFDTTHYRRLARSQVYPPDSVLELGSSYGLCTTILHEHSNGQVIGIDNSSLLVKECQAKYPHMQFECVDVMQHGERVDALLQGRTIVFVDIGGDRCLEDVVAVLSFIMEKMKEVQLIVVKSESLVRDLEERDCVRPDGWIEDAWWPSIHQVVKTLQGQALLGSDRPKAEPWYLTAKAAQFVRKPSRYPSRVTADGQWICRVHNYTRAGCPKIDACAYNHSVCHHCLVDGHRALHCPIDGPPA
ncbi:hypothetical protein BZG36_02507 [Bifiguratus adelaidae]|uniref:C3H1-type domain-containing protein n=1 Tax=Bifiguratus adelaidae TaxID=1938954 RepID=A0A261Y2W6_9FUNG|nr:hypothetical protein BZG36_02507 [Bifiguratus adelaidae]